jgi:hypothetical protein
LFFSWTLVQPEQWCRNNADSESLGAILLETERQK